jgi:hypothetical protein
MIVAYADPPYPGQARKHYRHHPDFAGEVDHGALLARLTSDYQHWALSTNASTLQYVLGLPECPRDVRVAAWVKPFARFKPGINPAYAWEPLIFRGARKRRRTEETVRDWVSVSVEMAGDLVGQKPDGFSFWLFLLMGMRPGDRLVDLFPGSGAVTRAWDKWQRQLWAA